MNKVVYIGSLQIAYFCSKNWIFVLERDILIYWLYTVCESIVRCEVFTVVKM